MPDIVLNARFNNPHLPTIPLLGFYDDFDRPDSSTLGVTSEEWKPWVLLPEGRATRGMIVNGTAQHNSAGGASLECVDANTSDGVLEAQYSLVTGNGSVRLCLRAQSDKDYLTLIARATYVELRRYSTSESFEIVATESVTYGDTTTFQVTMQGENITAHKDEDTLFGGTLTIPHLLTGTLHGFQYNAVNDSDIVDWIRFTPYA